MALSNALGYIQDKFNITRFRRLYFEENGERKSLNVGAFEEQRIQLSNTITDAPVEFGANLADSVYRNPEKIQLTIIVGDSDGVVASVVEKIKDVTTLITDFNENFISNLAELGLEFIDSNATGNLKSSKVFNEVIRLKENFTQLELVTKDRVYRNLLIENIDRVINLQNSGGAVITVSLKSLLTFNVTGNNTLIDLKSNNGFMSRKEISDSILEAFN